jgi:cytochrome c oxidase subunit 3|tara:strand:+ start:232 stop:783 length:552 start_codon:yes stop_codon:yes gene_type:complete
MEITVEKNAKTQLLWIGMGSILMFFAGLTSAYIVRKPEGDWLDFVLPEYFTFSTIVIVLSSLLLFFVKGRLRNKKSIYNIVISVLALGLLFSFFQFKGWQELIAQGVYLTGEGSNASGSFLYVLTLAHLVHLIGGLIALGYISFKSKQNTYTIENCLAIDLTSVYWHFLALLWLFLFVLINFY